MITPARLCTDTRWEGGSSPNRIASTIPFEPERLYSPHVAAPDQGSQPDAELHPRRIGRRFEIRILQLGSQSAALIDCPLGIQFTGFEGTADHMAPDTDAIEFGCQSIVGQLTCT